MAKTPRQNTASRAPNPRDNQRAKNAEVIPLNATQNARPAPFIIVGGGMCGTLMALFLAQRGYAVELIERRPDPRAHEAERGRSINMALSERGLNALRAVGLENQIKPLCIPMYGRGVHDTQGNFSRQAYGRPGQHINSISRRDLNLALIDAAAREPSIQMHFDARVDHVDLATKSVSWSTGRKKTTIQGRLIIGADGAASVVRAAMLRDGLFDFSQHFIEHGYKELLIPATHDGGPQIDPNHLHIWPRHEHMLIALPNQDNSFTATLFLALRGDESFESLDTHDALHAFFQTYFPEAQALIPDLAEQFFSNPVGTMGTLQIHPSVYQDAAVVIGDAAHAMVPFYGQGMNAAFEDCFELDKLFDRYDPSDLGEILRVFSERRRPHTEAIRKLAIDNFLEMRSSVVRPDYLVKKRAEQLIQAILPNRFIPMYSMISFTTIPYQDAVERAARQDRAIARGLIVGGAAIVAATSLAVRALRRRRR